MRPALTVLAAALVLAGCSGEAPGTGPEPDGVTATSLPRPPTPEPAATARPALVPAVTVNDRAGVPLALAPVTLHRQGRLAALELAARNASPDRPANLADLLRGPGTRFDRVTLLDPASGRRTAVVTDARDDCLCTSFLDGMVVEPGATAVVTAYLAAPPANARAVTVELPGVAAFANVPVG